MTELINLLPKKESLWAEIPNDELGLLLHRQTDGNIDLDLERIAGFRQSPADCKDFEYLGEGDQGKVYGIGEYAVKFLQSRTRFGRGVYGDFNQLDPLNQVRIAEGVRVGLDHLRTPITIAPQQHAYASWESYGSSRSFIVMDRVDVDDDSPEIADREVLSCVKKEASKALKKVGIKPKTIYWHDLEKNILMSNGSPVLMDLLPVDEFLQRYPLHK